MLYKTWSGNISIIERSMMIMKKKCFLELVLCFVLLYTFFLSGISVMNAEASTRENLSKINETIAIGENTKINIENSFEGAVYGYASSNKKVATVSKVGKVTGLTEGTAFITVSRKYTGIIGICKVTVKKASIYNECKVLELHTKAYRNYSIYNAHMPLEGVIAYLNPKAAYKYVFPIKKITITKKGNITKMALKNNEKAKVKVIETYKKKTRVVGYINIIGKNKKFAPIKISKTFKCIKGNRKDTFIIDKDIEKVEKEYNVSNVVAVNTDDIGFVLTDKNYKATMKNQCKYAMIRTYDFCYGLVDQDEDNDEYDCLIPNKVGVSYLHYFVKNEKTKTWKKLRTYEFNVKSTAK